MTKSVGKSFPKILLFLLLLSVTFRELEINISQQFVILCRIPKIRHLYSVIFRKLGIYIPLHSGKLGRPFMAAYENNCRNSEINDYEMQRYFFKPLSPSRRFPTTVYYTESSNFRYFFKHSTILW